MARSALLHEESTMTPSSNRSVPLPWKVADPHFVAWSTSIFNGMIGVVVGNGGVGVADGDAVAVLLGVAVPVAD
jgi:hypothetical protein